MRLAVRAILTSAVATALLLPTSSAAIGSVATDRHRPHGSDTVEIIGAVDAPSRLTVDQLAELPQTTLPDLRHRSTGQHQLTGVLLKTLIDRAEPQLPAGAKNGGLRVTATVSGRHGRAVTTAWGELDANFGNHPALLVLRRDGRSVRHAPELAFPGDSDTRRGLDRVTTIEVAGADPSTATPIAGDLVVTTDRRTVTVTAARLAALPQQTATVSFLASGAPQTRIETGPTLTSVLRAAHVRVSASTSVAASATDGYVAAVTPGEASSGGRTLLVSLIEDGQTLVRPRLVVGGDVRGGRYVSDLTTLTVTAARCR